MLPAAQQEADAPQQAAARAQGATGSGRQPAFAAHAAAQAAAEGAQAAMHDSVDSLPHRPQWQDEDSASPGSAQQRRLQKLARLKYAQNPAKILLPLSSVCFSHKLCCICD